MNIRKIIGIIINIIIKGAILLTFVGLYLAIFEKELLKSWIEILKEFILELGMWNYPIAFISSIIESFPILGIALPSQNILMAIAGFFGENNYINLIYIIILASIGSIVGNYIGYILGVKYGENFIKTYGMWIGIMETDVKYLKKSLHKWGATGIILGKFHATTRTFLPFIAGMSGMENKKFIIYNIIGSIIWSTSMIILGVFFAKYYELLVDYAGTIMTIITIITAIYIYFFKKKEFLKYWREKNEEMDKKFDIKK